MIGITKRLSIVPRTDIDDEKIVGYVVTALERNGKVDVRSVDVRVEKGIVTLSGTVPSWTARHAAYEAAVFTEGVVNINDNLTVG